MNAQRERCVAELADASCASLVYGCLVAIMAQGPGEDRRVTAAIREQLVDSAAMPALVTSADALIEAIRALGARRVALVTPYMKPIAQKVVDYIEAEHTEVTDWVAVAELADALILSACVQMPSLPLIEPAEAEFGLPVLSAATATAFTLLRRLELPTVLPGAGSLLQKDRRESDLGG